MSADEIWKGEAIAVQKDEVICGGMGNCPIAYGASAKPIVVLPGMVQSEAYSCLPELNALCRLWARSVIGNQYFTRGMGLLSKRIQHRMKRIGSIIRCHDDAGFDHMPSL